MTNLRKLRIQAGFNTQVDAAEEMGYCTRTLEAWESDKDPRNPPRVIIKYYQMMADLRTDKQSLPTVLV